jgi:hypothetical protein
VADSDAFGGSGGLIAVDPVNGRQTPLSPGRHVRRAVGGGVRVRRLDSGQRHPGVRRRRRADRVDPDSARQTKVVASDVSRRPFGIAVDNGGHVVVAYIERVLGLREVMRIDPTNGQHTLVSPHPRVVIPAGLALDAAGNVFVTDPDPAEPGSRLHRLDTAGLATVLSINVPPGAIYSGITLEPSGSILVTNGATHDPPQVLRFTPSGALQTVVSEARNLVFPIAVALQANTTILLLDRRNGITRVDPLTGDQVPFSTGDRLVARTGIAIATR